MLTSPLVLAAHRDLRVCALREAGRSGVRAKRGVWVMALSVLDLETLRAVPTEGVLRAQAYAVWTDRRGEVQMGPVRMRRVLADGSMMYECSPFPGAWDWHVPESAILRVRHLGALSLHTMACVCRGSEWDAHFPAPECRTPGTYHTQPLNR